MFSNDPIYKKPPTAQQKVCQLTVNMNQWGYSLLARLCIARPPRIDMKSLSEHLIAYTCKQVFPTWPNQVAGLAASRISLITDAVSPSIFLERYIHNDLDAYPTLMPDIHYNRKLTCLHVIIPKSSLPKSNVDMANISYHNHFSDHIVQFAGSIHLPTNRLDIDMQYIYIYISHSTIC